MAGEGEDPQLNHQREGLFPRPQPPRNVLQPTLAHLEVPQPHQPTPPRVLALGTSTSVERDRGKPRQTHTLTPWRGSTTQTGAGGGGGDAATAGPSAGRWLLSSAWEESDEMTSSRTGCCQHRVGPLQCIRKAFGQSGRNGARTVGTIWGNAKPAVGTLTLLPRPAPGRRTSERQPILYARQHDRKRFLLVRFCARVDVRARLYVCASAVHFCVFVYVYVHV